MRSKGTAVIAAFMAAALLALAFILPEWLSAVHDRQLLDSPALQLQDEEQEGFAESIQLTVAEKVMLLRSGEVNVMQLGQEEVEGVYASVLPDGWELTLNVSVDKPVLPEMKAATDEEITSYLAELNQTWEERLEAVQTEIRSLQAVGGLPDLWDEEDEPLDCTGYGELLYIDPDTRMSFQVYHLTLSRNTMSMRLMVDIQSGRILSFTLQWGREDIPSWGLRGAANFGGVWRNYWGMDSVSSGWYDDYTRNILERAEELYRNNGDYASHGQISFTYDGQSLSIPLECEGRRGRSFVIRWNV